MELRRTLCKSHLSHHFGEKTSTPEDNEMVCPLKYWHGTPLPIWPMHRAESAKLSTVLMHSKLWCSPASLGQRDNWGAIEEKDSMSFQNCKNWTKSTRPIEFLIRVAVDFCVAMQRRNTIFPLIDNRSCFELYRDCSEDNNDSKNFLFIMDKIPQWNFDDAAAADDDN